MEQIKEGWFYENNELWHGERFSLEVEEILHHQKSFYQDILVLRTKSHGKALILDGIIQCTEKDEFSYQEMISFLPLCAHPNPSKVLIVGGGDGGVAREVVKHPLVKEVVQVEIDEDVIEVCKKYLPSMAQGFSSPKLNLKICDGFEYIKNCSHTFDVIITDSSDPIGPAVNLYTNDYFEMLRGALKPDGIICSQGGTFWSQLEHIKNTIANCKKSFGTVKYAWSSVPTYPTGQIGFILATVKENVIFERPQFVFTPNKIELLQLKYYNSNIHEAAFILPNFVKKELGG
ncbi:spermidine synthase [Agrilus planipennis]|uniref:Spermidine synthase n=1 Tax=Agrilus planipennis TaxID=224129 RepID=A0A1W4XW13_AGRPL|nr:spermidine synthase [Agrilus planipennis]